MHHIVRLVVIATALVGVTASRASAELLCQKKSGAVFARTACKRHERVVTSSADTNVASLQGELAAAQAAEAALQAQVQALQTLTGAFQLTNGGHTLRLKGLTGLELSEGSVCVGPDFAGSKLGTAHACAKDSDCQEICVNGAATLLGHTCNTNAACNSAGAADGQCSFTGSCAAPGISLEGSDWTFTAVNVHVVDGRGAQDFRANGLGNLTVGYNQARGSGRDDRSGSHNVILGDENNYTGFGSLVGGAANTVANGCLVFSEDSTGGDTGVVLGGVSNTAGGGFDAQGSVVVGGQRNTVTDISSVAVGGLANSISNNDVFCAECVITGGLHLGLSSGGQFTEDGHWAAGGNATPAFHWP